MAIDIDANRYHPSDGMLRDIDVDHSALATEWIEGIVGAAVTAMSLVELQADGKWDDADASAGGAQRKLGWAMTAGPLDGDTIIIILRGVIRDDTFNFNEGERIFASATAGQVTHTLPVVGGDTQRVVAYGGFDADSMFFEPVPGVFPTA